MATNYAKYAQLMKALGDESRVKILTMLSAGELCACEILEKIQITQPTLSYHMKILSESGLVNSRRDGVWMRYSINRDTLARLQQFVNKINANMGCCLPGGSTCCPSPQEKKELVIDLLYLDLDVCTRCQGAEKNLEEALTEVSGVLKAAGFTVVLNKINITTPELAEKYRFVSSPTIRINGIDLIPEVKESTCQECGDLCGSEVDCRVWFYQGVEYTEPPKALIINAILKAVYGGELQNPAPQEEYKLPENLRRFFAGLEKKKK